MKQDESFDLKVHQTRSMKICDKYKREDIYQVKNRVEIKFTSPLFANNPPFVPKVSHENGMRSQFKHSKGMVCSFVVFRVRR
jgi:hypothetical protein